MEVNEIQNPRDMSNSMNDCNPFESYYKMNKYLFSMLGYWPLDNSKRMLVWRILILVQLINVVLFLIVVSFAKKNDPAIVFDAITMEIILTTAIIRYIGCWVNVSKGKRILHELQSHWRFSKDQDEEMEIILKHARIAQICTFTMAFFTYSVLLIEETVRWLPKCLDLFIPLNESRPRIRLQAIEELWDPSVIGLFYYVHCSTNFIGATIFVGFDTMYIIYTQHACSLLAVTGHQFKNLKYGMEGRVRKRVNHGYTNNYYDLKTCIKNHVKAIEFVCLLESYNTITFFILTIVALPGLAFLLTQLSTMTVVAYITRCVIYIVGMILDWFLICYSGQLVINHSNVLIDNLYSSQWLEAPSKIQYLMIFVMKRLMKPSQLTVYNILVCSSQFWAKMVQTAFSYYTVISSM